MKKVFSILLIIAILSVSCVSFGAATVYKYGDWTLSALTGLPDATFGVQSYGGSDAEVTVPNDYGGYPITAINSYAFAGNTTLTKVTLSEGITKIGDGAFMQCRNLIAVEIPDSVTEIGETAFSGCNNLVIYVKNNSYAIEYAKEKGVEYVRMNVVTFLLGDVDGDGEITITDVSLIQRYLCDLPVPDPEAVVRCGDINGDGVDIADATRIQRFIAGISVPEPIGELVETVVD
ncbi:MAG: leucine-rich repeat protein [Ruminococcus sp.]|nr:leucine-rich repeat protein [Ruminococcus sp.]